MAAEGEDETLRKLIQKTEQKSLAKRRPRKRKTYLGPDSVDIIPRSSRHRFQSADHYFERGTLPNDITFEPSCGQAAESACTYSNHENQVCVSNVTEENLAPPPLISVLGHHANSSYNVSVCDMYLSSSSSTEESIAQNSTGAPQSYCDQVVAAAAANQENQVRVAYLSVQPLSQVDFSHHQSSSVCQSTLDPQGGGTAISSSNISDCIRVLDLPLCHGSVSQPTSKAGSNVTRTNSVEIQHQSRSKSRASSSGSRSSESSASLFDSDRESDSDEHEEHEREINNGCDDHGNEERGGGQEECDQPADDDGAEGERRGGGQEEQEVPQDGGADEGRGREQRHNHADRQERPPTHEKLREAMQGGFLANIEVPVQASRNDILYMALSYSSKNNETSTAFCNLINFINCIFVSPVLPASQYLLDSLLVSDVGVHYYFYCKLCFKSFGEIIDYENIKFRNCEICETQNNVSDLRLSTFFVIFDLPIQLDILFSKPELAAALSTPAEAIERSRPGVFSDICDGSMYKEFCAAVANFQERILSMHFSVDGSPIAQSSAASIWPIQGQIHELPPNLRMKNLLLCGLWFGKSHPKMNLFLEPFVSHMRTLSQGFPLHAGPNRRWDTRFYCIGCCVDSGARGSVQGIKTHGGYFSCNWCKVCGVYINRAVRYPLTDRRPDERTHNELVTSQRGLLDRRAARADPLEEEDASDVDEQEAEPNGPRNPDLLGVIAVSPLINMPQFSMVDSFIVDNMHCVDMGVVKGQISTWLEEANNPYYIKLSLPELNRRIMALRPPLEFRRMPRILKERLNYKAREYNNFLWCSYIILKNILPNRYLNTWLLLVQAIFLLSQTEVSIQQIDIAEKLIIHYLAAVQVEYGEKNMSFNLHILRHLADHVRRWGPLWATSAYVFEDGNGHLKNLIHTVQCVPHQVVRHWSWDLAKDILHPHVSEKARNYASSIAKPKHQNKISYLTGTCRLIGTPKLANLSEEEIFLCEENHRPVDNLQCFDKLIYKNCAYVVESKRCARTCNSFAQLNDKTVVLIRKILHNTDDDQVNLFVSDINWEPILTLPQGVQMDRDDHCLREVQFIHEELRFIKCTDLKIVCFRTNLPNGDLLSVLPNVQNRH